MGVPGLTSYVNQKSDIYFVPYRLSHTILIIDGYALASELYNSSSKINPSFGGDYDKYCKVISDFFEKLKKCNVIPLIICDGGYEKKKLSTVRKRNLFRVYALEKISPSSNNVQCFPLMLRHVFREKLLELSVCVLQTDFEADNEIAALARHLNAPVLSSDSDFFIYDVSYIPLSSVPFHSCETDGKSFYIPCQMFSVDNFLKSFGNLPKTMLPLLATLLGNDYISASYFKVFYSHLKMDKSKNLKPGQRRVKGIVNWLREETFESAMTKILECLKKKARNKVKNNIRNIMKGYTNVNTTLDCYVPDSIAKFKKNERSTEAVGLADTFKSLCCIESSGESDDGDISSEKSALSSDEEERGEHPTSELDEVSSVEDESEFNMPLCSNVYIPPWLLNESRIGNIYPSINTLLLLRVYFFCPQVEDYESIWAGSVTLPILQVVVGLLGLPSIKYWYRAKCKYTCSELLPINSVGEIDFPDLKILNEFSLSHRKLIFLKTLKIDDDSVLECCPPDWQLLFTSIVYWIRTNEDSSVKHWHLHALIITMITINVIGEKIGLFWQKKTFLNRYGSKIKSALGKNVPKIDYVESTNLYEALESVTHDDCLIALYCLIPYFHIDENLNKNSKKLSRSTVHVYAQLQSVFEMAVTLNALLLQPFKRSHLGKFYNGTLLYNFSVNFKKRTNLPEYMKSFLGQAPSILNLFFTVCNYVNMLVPEAPQQTVRPKRSRKKKVVTVIRASSGTDEKSENSDFEDSNNRFALLNKKVNINR